jgi:hypothetical protein
MALNPQLAQVYDKPVDKLWNMIRCWHPATSGKQALARLSAECFWLQ